jgi:hypothetical protein
VAFDNSGAVFAVACSQTQTIALYAHATMDHVRHLFHFSDRGLTSGTFRSRGIDRSRPSRYFSPTPNTHFHLDIILKRRKLYPSWNILRIPLYPRCILPRHGPSLTRPYRSKSTKRGRSKLEWRFEIRNFRIRGWANMRMGFESY